MFPSAGPEARSATFFVLLKSDLNKPVTLTCGLHESESVCRFLLDAKPLAEATQTVSPGGPRWVRFDFEKPVKIDSPLMWLSLPRVPGVWCFLANEAPAGSCRAFGGPKWTVLEHQYYAVAFDPPVTTPLDGEAANVINGFSRPIGTRRNQWISDPAEPLPQSIELTFSKKTVLQTVLLTFDTNVDTKRFAGTVPEECVRDYELAVYDGNKWKTIASVKG